MQISPKTDQQAYRMDGREDSRPMQVESIITCSRDVVTSVVKPCLAKNVTALLSAYVRKKVSLSFFLASSCKGLEMSKLDSMPSDNVAHDKRYI